MSIFSMTHPAKCKHCFFHIYVWQGRKRVGICILNRLDKGITENDLHPDDVRRSGKDKACANFKL